MRPLVLDQPMYGPLRGCRPVLISLQQATVDKVTEHVGPHTRFWREVSILRTPQWAAGLVVGDSLRDEP